MKRFLRTTKQTFESVQDKSQYNNSLVLIEDQKCIWSNGVYYGLQSDVNWSDIKNNPIITNGNGLKYLSDDGTYKEINLEIPVVLPNPESLEIVVVDNNGNSNTYTYDGSTNLQVPIDLSNITNTIDVTFESDFAPNLYVVGEGNQFRLTGDGYIPTQDEFNTLSNTVNGKQDKISDLDTIRNNANLGASALQSIPSEYVTETELNNKGYLTSIPSEYVTETELTNKGYATTSQVNAKQDTLVSGTNIKTINGTSILGSGDIKTNKPLQTSTSTSMTLTPNVYHRNTSTSLSRLTITLGTASDNTILNEYLVEFTTRSAGTTITLPSNVKWVNGVTPTFEASTTYQISIVNNLGVVTKFK